MCLGDLEALSAGNMTQYHSADFSAATDGAHPDLCSLAATLITQKTGLTQLDEFYQMCMIGHRLEYPSQFTSEIEAELLRRGVEFSGSTKPSSVPETIDIDADSDELDSSADPIRIENKRFIVEQASGQLMGSPLSFVGLNLINAAITIASHEDYIEKDGWSGASGDLWADFFSCHDLRIARQKGSRAKLLKAFDQLPVRFNGDDTAGLTNDEHYKIWSRITAAGGMKPSVGKNFRHSAFVQMNSETYVPYRSHLFGEIVAWDYQPFLNQRFLVGGCRSKPVGGSVDSSFTVSSLLGESPLNDAGAKARALLRGFDKSDHRMLFNMLRSSRAGSYVAESYDLKVSLWTPKCLGGLGLPEFSGVPMLITSEQLAYSTLRALEIMGRSQEDLEVELDRRTGLPNKAYLQTSQCESQNILRQVPTERVDLSREAWLDVFPIDHPRGAAEFYAFRDEIIEEVQKSGGYLESVGALTPDLTQIWAEAMADKIAHYFGVGRGRGIMSEDDEFKVPLRDLPEVYTSLDARDLQKTSEEIAHDYHVGNYTKELRNSIRSEFDLSLSDYWTMLHRSYEDLRIAGLHTWSLSRLRNFKDECVDIVFSQCDPNLNFRPTVLCSELERYTDDEYDLWESQQEHLVVGCEPIDEERPSPISGSMVAASFGSNKIKFFFSGCNSQPVTLPCASDEDMSQWVSKKKLSGRSRNLLANSCKASAWWQGLHGWSVDPVVGESV